MQMKLARLDIGHKGGVEVQLEIVDCYRPGQAADPWPQSADLLIPSISF